MNVLIIAVTASRRIGVASDIEALAASGAAVTLLTSRADAWPGLDPRVRVVDLAEAEARMPVVSLARRTATAARGLLARGRGPTASPQEARHLEPASGPAGHLDGAMAGDRPQQDSGPRPEAAPPRPAAAGPRELARRAYRGVRPWLLWRVARRSVLPALDLGATDLVVVADAQAIPIGWHVARAHPHLEVTFALDRARLSTGCGPTMPYGGRGPSDEAVAERGEEWRS